VIAIAPSRPVGWRAAAIKCRLSERFARFTIADCHTFCHLRLPDQVTDGMPSPTPGIVAAQSWRGGWHDVPATPVGFNYSAKGLSWDAVRGSLISTA